MIGKELYKILDDLYTERHNKILIIKVYAKTGQKDYFDINRGRLMIIEDKIKYYEGIEISE